MCVLIVSATSVWKICHSKKNLAIYDQKCILVFFVKYLLPLLNFDEIWIFLTDF
jgi:hypothetical protein